MIQLSACVAKSQATDDIPSTELMSRLGSGETVNIIDVRTPKEYRQGHVPGALNIPHTEIADRIGEIVGLRNQDIVLYCETGARASVAEDILRNAGFNKLLHLEGDMAAWREQSRPIETQ